MKNLVMGMAANYDVSTLHNFVTSFRQHMDCDILLFTQNLCPQTLEWLKAKGILTLPLGQEGLLPHNSRFLAFRSFLAQDTNYTHIFLTDVRDVIAQGDIFERLKTTDGMHIFLEESRMYIGRCQHNATWVAFGYGLPMLEEYKDLRISCVGTLYGDKESMMLYLEALSEELLAPAPDGILRIETYGMDTAAHLHLYHSGRLNERLHERGSQLVVHENAGPVFTVGYVPVVLMSSTGVVVSVEQDFSCVVHQYDRHRLIRTAIDALHRPVKEETPAV